MTVCKMSVEKKLRKLQGKRTLEILINSQRGNFFAEFYGKWGIRVECTVLHIKLYYIILYYIILYYIILYYIIIVYYSMLLYT